MFQLRGKRVFVAGHRGMVGRALLRRLALEEVELVTVSRRMVDLRDQAAVKAWMADHRPQVVIVAAATVGGILANDSRPAEFLYDNLMIEGNVIHASHEVGAEKLLFLGSSCIYPKHADQPMTEEVLLTGPLEPTNQWYAVAKIAGLKLCEAYRKQYGADFITAMPTNLYGPGDNFDVMAAHVIPALMRKAHDARQAGAAFLDVWGSGKPRREFLHVDDLADGCVHLLKTYSDAPPVNVGTGEDVTIAELARLIAETVGFTGDLRFDPTKPDGTPRKLLDVSRLRALGWQARTPLPQGLRETYEWFTAALDRREARVA